MSFSIIGNQAADDFTQTTEAGRPVAGKLPGRAAVIFNGHFEYFQQSAGVNPAVGRGLSKNVFHDLFSLKADAGDGFFGKVQCQLCRIYGNGRKQPEPAHCRFVMANR